MFQRVMVAVVGIPFLLVVLLLLPEWAPTILVTAMCAMGAHELLHAVGVKNKALRWTGVLAAALVPVDIYAEAISGSIYETADGGFLASGMGGSLLPLLALAFVFVLFALAIGNYGKPTAIPFGHLTMTLFAGLVFPSMLGCLLRLRLVYELGPALVFVPLCISFGSDTFALFAGMLFGKHKLAPHVSPKKTVEGGIGGIVGGVFGMALMWAIIHWTIGYDLCTWWEAVILGVVGSVISQMGDLSFSVIKREFGVKDYGKLLPGHGGILDRFDSVTFVSPCVWLLLTMWILR